MTGFDTEWKTVEDCIDEQKTVMTVHFRPDNKPKDKAEWYEWLGNYAHTMSDLLRKGALK